MNNFIETDVGEITVLFYFSKVSDRCLINYSKSNGFNGKIFGETGLSVNYNMMQINSIWKKRLKMLINKVLSTAGLVKRLIIMQKLEELKNRHFIPKI